MKIREKFVTRIGAAALLCGLLAMTLFAWKTDVEARKRDSRMFNLLERGSERRIRAESEIAALRLEAFFNDTLLRLSELNAALALDPAGARSTIRHFPFPGELFVSLTAPEQTEQRFTRSENGKIHQNSIPQTVLARLPLGPALIVPENETGCIRLSISNSAQGTTVHTICEVDLTRLLKSMLPSGKPGVLVLLHGKRMLKCETDEDSQTLSELKTRMLLLGTRLIPGSGARRFDMDSMITGKGETWELSASTLGIDTVPTQELRLVRALPSEFVSTAPPQGKRILICNIVLFAVLGYLLFFAYLFHHAGDLAKCVESILKFATALSRGDEPPKNLRSGTTEEFRELSSIFNHLRDKLSGMTLRLKKSHERELLARSDAENSNRLKSVLLNDMVAELQEPVGMMTGFSSLLQRKLKNCSEVQAPLARIHDEALAAGRLLTALSNLSEFDLSRHEPVYTEFDATDVIRELSDTCVPLAAERRVRFEIHWPGMHGKIISDREAMPRILTLAASTLISIAQPDSHVRWSGSATEDGILFRCFDEKEPGSVSLATLFLERISSSGSKHSVTGFAAPILNFTLIKLHSELLGARLTVLETEKGGTEISLFFPKPDPAEITLVNARNDEERDTNLARTSFCIFSPDRARRIVLHPGQRYSVLVADKSDSVYTMFCMMLEGEPCTLAHAATPAECLEKLKSGHFDFLLLDLKFQKAFCMELLSAIRTGNSNQGLVILALGSGMTEAELAAIKESGVDRCLRKPASVEKLTATIHEFIAE